LRPERVSVIDETGKLLADEAAPDNSLSGVSSDERKLAYENRLRSEVEAIVSSVVGPGHARIQINADFDVLARSARPSISTSITGWWRVAKWCS
jgi:flagellar M-ring protein FliF